MTKWNTIQIKTRTSRHKSCLTISCSEALPCSVSKIKMESDKSVSSSLFFRCSRIPCPHHWWGSVYKSDVDKPAHRRHYPKRVRGSNYLRRDGHGLEMAGIQIRGRSFELSPRFPGGTWVCVRGHLLDTREMTVRQLFWPSSIGFSPWNVARNVD